MESRAYFSIVCILSVFNPAVTEVQTDADLLRHILVSYSVHARPLTDPRKPVNVHVNFYVTSFEIEEQYQEFISRGWFHLRWTDEFLSWNETVYPTSKLIISPTLIWLPDLAILNAKNDKTSLRRSLAHVALFPDGTVLWSPEFSMTTSCAISVTSYPFDSQVCDITLTTWYSEMHEQILTSSMKNRTFVDTLEPNTQWKYVGSSVSEQIQEFDNKTFPLLIYTLRVKRMPYYQIVHTFIPTVLLSYMNSFVFILPIHSGETTSFGVAIFLAFAVFIGPVKESLPVTSTETCLFTVYMISQFCLGGVETCLCILTLRLSAKTTTVSAKSWWIVLLPRKLRKETVYPEISQIDSQVGHDSNEEVDKLPHTDKCQDKPITVDVELDWMDLGSRLNTLFFFMFVVIKTVCLLYVLIQMMS